MWLITQPLHKSKNLSIYIQTTFDMRTLHQIYVILLCSFLLAVPLMAVAKSVDIEPLQRLYDSLSPDDTLAIKRFVALSQQTISQSRRAGDSHAEAMACYMLGEYYNNVDLKKAYYYNSRGIALAGSEQSNLSLSLYCNQATNLFMQGKLELSRQMFLRAAAIGENVGNNQILSTVYTTLGIVYRRMMKPDTALIYYNRALHLVRREALYSEESNLLANIAVLYSNQNRPAEAMNYARKSVEVANRSGDKEQQMQTCHTLGSLLMKAQRYNEAKLFLHRSIAYARTMHSPMLQLGDIAFLVSCYDETNQPDSANIMIDMGNRLMAELPADNHYALTFMEVKAKHYMKTEQYAEALRGFLWIESRQNVNSQITRDVLYRYIADCYAHLYNYREAFAYSNRANMVRDTLQQKQTEQQMSEFWTKYKLQEKELTNARLTEHNAKQRAFILCLVVLALVLLIVIITLLYRRKMQQIRISEMQRRNEIEASRKYIKGLEDERLRLSREMHDGICNDLIGVEMTMKMQTSSSEELLCMVKEIRQNVRQMSHRLMPPKFVRTSICQLLSDMAQQISEKAAYTVRFATNMPQLKTDDEVALSLYRIAQEVLNNIALHANPTLVELSLNAKDNLTYVFKIENDGAADHIPGHTLSTNSGIGHQTIQSRAQGIRAEIATSQHDEKFIITITGPIHL